MPGQTPLSWDVPGQNHLPQKLTKKKGKERFKTEQDVQMMQNCKLLRHTYLGSGLAALI